MATEWGERQADGSVNVVRKEDDGTVHVVRNEPYNVNQGQGQTPTTGSQPSTGGGSPTYATPNGPRTIDQMRAELTGAGYNGGTDDASIIAAYNRTASGTGATGTTGTGTGVFSDMYNQGTASNREYFEEQKRQYNQDAALRQKQYESDLALAQQQIATAKTQGEVQQGELALKQAQSKLDQAKFENDKLNTYFDQQIAKGTLGVQQQNADTSLYGVQSGNETADRTLYGNLGTTLINTAAGLTGPRDWLKYNAATSGGKDLFTQLYGSQPVAQFSAPTESTQPMAVTDILGALGMPQAPQRTAVAPTSQQAQETVNQTVQTPTAPTATAQVPPSQYYQNMIDWSNKFKAGNGRNPTQAEWTAALQSVSGYSPQQANALYQQSVSYTNQFGQLATPAMWDTWFGAQNPTQTLTGTSGTAPAPTATVTPAATTGQGTSSIAGTASVPTGTATSTYAQLASAAGLPATASTTTPSTAQTATTASESTKQNVPLPYQINPAVWDSMTDNAKQMTLGAAEAGQTAGGYINADDYQRQLNAARPKGTATKASTVNWQSARGVF